jgi:hypothetical protein
LRVGQAVPWSPAPDRFAQIVELRRTRIRLFYKTRNGFPRFATVAARRVVQEQMLFELDNPFDRAVMTKQKTFEV